MTVGNKIKQIKKEVKNISKLLGLTTPIMIRNDRLGNFLGNVYLEINKKTNKPYAYLEYNMTLLKTYPLFDIRHFVSHELMHVYLGHILPTDKTKFKIEYEAEDNALEFLKKIYPRTYQYVLKNLNPKQKYMDIDVYYKVFLKCYNKRKHDFKK